MSDPTDGVSEVSEIVDAERVTVAPTYEIQVPEPATERRTLYATVVQRAEDYREPVVPGWVRNREQRRTVVRSLAGEAVYRAAVHGKRSPKYLAKAIWYAPIGAGVGVWRLLGWAFDRESFSIRQHAATHNNVEDYLRLSRQRDKRASGRLWLAVPVLVAALVAVLLLVLVAPWWGQALAVVVAVPLLAWVGRPAHKPILTRVTVAPGFTRLTQPMVRSAMVFAGFVKGPDDITFPPPGVRTDGPGWLARFNLPEGMEAVKVITARDKLSSALRLPVDQVWPSAGPDHAGQVDLWVGKSPTSKMGAPRWALASPSARVDVFAGYPVGHDERLRPVKLVPFERNILIGGQPGAGKTSGGRAVVLGGLLDPSVEMWLAAFKAAEDFYDISQYCTRYLCGLDEETMKAADQMVSDGLREVQRRQAVLGRLKRAGKITEGKTSRELADAGLGLHPLFLVFDEVHELFLESKQAGVNMARLLKQGRSVFVFAVLISQVANKDSVPTEITRVVSSRWAMSLLDQTANDQIMGTGAYKRGVTGTVYRPEIDAGWGVSSGFSGAYVGACRAYWPNDRDRGVILARIEQLRGGQGGNVTTLDPEERDHLLDDVLRVFAHAGRPALSWQKLAELLAEAVPQRYSDVNAEALSALARSSGVTSSNVKADGQTLKGCYLKQVRQVAEVRQVTDGR